MPALTLQFPARTRSISMNLDLDPERSNEKSILGFIERGTLYEPDIANLMCNIVQEGDVVVDVGANAGFFTVLLGALVGKTGRVISFEPGEDNIGRLKNNIALNGFDHITVVEQPASDAPGEIKFFINSDDSGGNALWDPAAFPGNVNSAARPQVLTMQATTLDEQFTRLGLAPPKLIKIDTEGAECQVLAGCKGMLKGRQIPFVIAEYHPFGLAKMGASTQALRGFMEAHGYSTFVLYHDGAMPRFVPPATELDLPFIVNILFTTPENLARVYPSFFHHPGLTHPKQG